MQKPDEKKINGTSVVATNEEKVIPGIKLKINEEKCMIANYFG